jgi:hypothetical protein
MKTLSNIIEFLTNILNPQPTLVPIPVPVKKC